VSLVVIMLLALFGALALGVLVGLLYRGFLFIGDRRGLNFLADELRAEQRIQVATHQALAEMRAAARRFEQ
jgi:hypothetical protein